MVDIGSLKLSFPNLDSEFAVTSGDSADYNCVSWAAGDTTQWWWPIDGYWPRGVEERRTITSFVDAFRTLGYNICDNRDLEPEWEKVVIYSDRLDRPTHMARQLLCGWWTSKLGRGEDITHKLVGIEGPGFVNVDYGRVVTVLKRRRQNRE
jgi:hypothetical protein